MLIQIQGNQDFVNKFLGGNVQNSCGQCGHDTLKLTESQE